MKTVWAFGVKAWVNNDTDEIKLAKDLAALENIHGVIINHSRMPGCVYLTAPAIHGQLADREFIFYEADGPLFGEEGDSEPLDNVVIKTYKLLGKGKYYLNASNISKELISHYTSLTAGVCEVISTNTELELNNKQRDELLQPLVNHLWKYLDRDSFERVSLIKPRDLTDRKNPKPS